MILGAGASAPYDYPTGQGLVRQIVEGSESGEQYQARNTVGFSDDELKAFKEDLRHAESVDAFLEHRPDYLRIGKFLIAQRLIACEDEDKLSSWQDESKDYWYPYLREALITEKGAFNENRLSVVTFNYDRSLEQYLFSALKSRYGWSDEEAAEQLSVINFVHVHGTLGALPWQAPQNKFTRPYRVTQEPQAVLETSQSIRIVSDASDDGAEFRFARKLLEEADYIFCLGFGYSQTNVRRLGIVRILEDRKKTKAISAHGTALNLTGAERNALSARCPGIDLDHADRKVIVSLRNNSAFLAATIGQFK